MGSPPTVSVTAFPHRMLAKEVTSVPTNVVVASNTFSKVAQWTALSKCVRVEGMDGMVGSAAIVALHDGNAYFLTANHIISGLEVRRIEFFSKEIFQDSEKLKNNFYRDAVVALRSPTTDLALLKVKIDRLKPPGIATLPQPWDRPKYFPFEGLSVGCSEGHSPTCQIERIQGKPLVRRTTEFGCFFWESLSSSSEGRSGGPLFDARGRLIGICAGRQGNRSYFTHLDEIHAWLKENQYGWLWESKVRP
ncbi:MAG: trypsin-like peptidase domain-containing protein [Gemmataceae bacterium]